MGSTLETTLKVSWQVKFVAYSEIETEHVYTKTRKCFKAQANQGKVTAGGACLAHAPDTEITTSEKRARKKWNE